MGFTALQLCQRLGTVGASGTRDYVLERFKGGKLIPLPLFGRLGIGFYSAFGVSRRIKVVTKSRPHAQQYVWQWETGKSEFSIEYDHDFIHGRLYCGTKVLCFLEDEWMEFLEETRLESHLDLYAHMINSSITLVTKRCYGEYVAV